MDPPTLGALIVERILAISDVDAVVTYGSTARNDPQPGDLDLLVVGRGERARSGLKACQDSLDVDGRLSVSFYDWEDLDRRLREVPSFAAHLRDEGRIDGGDDAVHRLRTLLRSIPLTSADVERELRELDRRVSRIANEERLNGLYATAYGRLFAIGRAAAILQLMRSDVHVYDWRLAFDELGRRRPDLFPYLESVASLRPYYQALAGRIAPVSRPWEATTYDVAVAAVRRLTAA